jgi:hypothetical protein
MMPFSAAIVRILVNSAAIAGRARRALPPAFGAFIIDFSASKCWAEDRPFRTNALES